MGVTASGLPYPEDGDNTNVPGDLKALALRARPMGYGAYAGHKAMAAAGHIFWNKARSCGDMLAQDHWIRTGPIGTYRVSYQVSGSPTGLTLQRYAGTAWTPAWYFTGASASALVYLGANTMHALFLTGGSLAADVGNTSSFALEYVGPEERLWVPTQLLPA